MLQPKRTKYRKMQKGRMKGNAQRGNQIAFGSFAIKTLEESWITARQIEAARIAVTRFMKREGQIWIRIFPDKPVTKKPAEVRMGKGKGAPELWVAVARPGRILFEADGVSLDIAKEAMRLAAQKLPVKTKFIVRRDYKVNQTSSKKYIIMKQTDIKNLSSDDLQENLAEQTNLLVKLRMNHAVSPLENPMQIRAARKTVARLITELRKRELSKSEVKQD